MSGAQNEVVLKNIRYKGSDYYSMFCLSIIILSSVMVESMLVIAVFAFLYLIKIIRRCVLRARDVKPKLIINALGIQLPTQNKSFTWDEIKYAYVRSPFKSVGKDSIQKHTLFVITTDGSEERMLMNDLDYSQKEIREAIKGFSGREISDDKLYLYDQINEILNSNDYTQFVIDAFTKLWRFHINLAIACYIVIIVLSVYVQVAYSLIFSLGIGIVLMTLVLFLISELDQLRFKKEKYISDLTKEQYIEIATIYKFRIPKKMWPQILFSLLIIAAFLNIVSLLLLS